MTGASIIHQHNQTMPKNEIYRLTVKGLIHTVTKDDRLTGEIIDALELHMRRHYSKDGAPGIVLDPDTNILSFVTLTPDSNEQS